MQGMRCARHGGWCALNVFMAARQLRKRRTVAAHDAFNGGTRLRGL